MDELVTVRVPDRGHVVVVTSDGERWSTASLTRNELAGSEAGERALARTDAALAAAAEHAPWTTYADADNPPRPFPPEEPKPQQPPRTAVDEFDDATLDRLAAALEARRGRES